MFENIKADFKRVSDKSSYKGKGKIRILLIILFFNPGFQAVLNYRICHWLVAKKVPVLHIILQRITEIITGISIPPEVRVGKGLLIEHFGCIVIEDNSIIGEYCTITHCVTIGNKNPSGKVPVIGNNVYICVGAKVLGDITIGDNSVIGANAVVLKSFPANAVIAGIPSKMIRAVDKDIHRVFIRR